MIITKKRSVFRANCAKLQPHVNCDKLHAVDCNLPLVTTDQTCINMFISSKHDNCVRPRACYIVMMLVLNSHLLHCPLLLDSLTRGPARSTCTVSVMFVVLMRDTCPDNYIMLFCISVFHRFKSRRDRWSSKGTRQVADLCTSFLNGDDVSKVQPQAGRRSVRIEFEYVPLYMLFIFYQKKKFRAEMFGCLLNHSIAFKFIGTVVKKKAN